MSNRLRTILSIVILGFFGLLAGGSIADQTLYADLWTILLVAGPVGTAILLLRIRMRRNRGRKL